ncbi:MAG TPA: AAA family ATPase [Thermomicrobiales bacterium]|nr:AAA family ATPase [Thermomicrobiales bacterium]
MMSSAAPFQSPSTVVGRTKERAFLHEAFVQANAGHGQVVLVGGEAGIGKTTLVRDLLQDAGTAHSICLASQCYDLSTTPPYGPWLDLFASTPAIADGPQAPAAFAGGSLGAITDQARLYAEVREFVTEAAASHTVVIILEDLHWADPASLELLRYLAPRIGSLRVLLLLTYRDDEITRSNPFYQQLPQILRESGGLRLDLRPLTGGELTDLVRARWRLPAQQEEILVRYLSGHAEGNPFFATELLRALDDEGIVRSWAEGAAPAEIDRLVMPSLVQQVIDYRIDKLGSEARDRLAIASVIGQDVPLELWARVASLTESELLETVEAAVDSHVLEAGRSGTRVMFVHALTRAALYEGIFPPKRRVVHCQIADALIEARSQNPDAIAYHLVQAGDSRAPDWLITAGDAAQRSYAWLSAGDRFEQAAALLEASGGSEQTRGWLLYRLARLQRYRGGRRAIEALAEAERIGQRTSDPLLETDARYSLGIFQLFSGDFGQGIANMMGGIERMETELDLTMIGSNERIPWMADSLPSIDRRSLLASDGGIDVLRRAGMHHRRGGIPMFLAQAGRFREADAIARQFLEATADTPALGNWVVSAKGHCHLGAAIARVHVGDPAGAREHFEAGRLLYASLDHHAVMAFSMLCELRESVIPFSTRDVELRRRLGREASQALSRAAGSFPEGLSPERAMLVVHFLDGSWDEAQAIANDIPTHGTVILRREVVLTVAAIARAQGRVADARAALAQALPLGQATVPGTTLFSESTDVMIIAADLAIDQRSLVEARGWLETLDRWIAWSGATLGQAESQLRWARWYRAEGNDAQAIELAHSAIELARNPDQPLVHIGANRLLGEIAAGAGNTGDARVLLETSLDLAATCQIPYLEALAHASLSLLMAQIDDNERARMHYELAMPIVERLDLTVPRQQLAAVDARLAAPHSTSASGLTPRELEVLKLVSLGMTDAAIGDALFISSRTASQHLRSIFGKLGVSTRAAATRYAVEHGLA